MRRLDDWTERLTAYLDAVRSQPFDPARHNCATFVLGAIRATTGDDPLTQLVIDLPDTEREVARILVERGGVRQIAESYFGHPAELGVIAARRGDVVVAPANVLIAGAGDRETLGIVEAGAVLFLTPSGLWHEPITTATGFWRLG